jgi:hypothetical protein
VGIVVRVGTCVQRWAWALLCAWALAYRGGRGHCCARGHLRSEERIDTEMLARREKKAITQMLGHLRAETGVGVVVRVGTCVQRWAWALLCAFTL